MAKKEKVYLFDHSPHLRDEWDYEKNVGIDPETTTSASNRKVSWVCSRGHGFKAYVSNRSRLSTMCPFCSGNKVLVGFNNLFFTNPELEYQWDHTNNSSLDPCDISAGSNKSAYWICSEGHEYSSVISQRALRGCGCPYCSGQKVLLGYNDLASTNPEISLFWNSKRNPFKPSSVSRGSNKLVWWTCLKGHDFQSTVGNMSRELGVTSGCPVCSGKRVLSGYNDLDTLFPEISLDWDYDKNVICPSEVTSKSNKKFWWLCDKKHQHLSSAANRTSSLGCPSCSEWGTSKIEQRLEGILGRCYGFYVITRGANLPIWFRKNKSMSVDLFIEEVRLAVEYDGAFFHHDISSVARDADKSQAILSEGIFLVRVRENDLPHLDIQHPNLLQLSVPYSKTDEHLIEAVEKIKDWLDAKQQEKTL